MSIAAQLPSHRERRNMLFGSACDLAESSSKE
jgi:hypothetical protein